MDPPKSGRALEGDELEARQAQHDAIARRFGDAIEEREGVSDGE